MNWILVLVFLLVLCIILVTSPVTGGDDSDTSHSLGTFPMLEAART